MKIALPLVVTILAMTPGLSAQDPPDDESPYALEVQEIAAATGLALEFQESASFAWALGIPKAQAGPVVQAAEDGLKVFLQITELGSWEDLWGPAPGGTKKCLVALLNNKMQYTKFLEWYQARHKPWAGFKQEAGKVTYWPQPTPRVCIAMHLKPVSLEGVRNVMVHEVGHLCILRFRFNNNFVPPWLEEGFGCYLEARVLGRNNCYCFSGGYGDRAARLEKLSDIEFVKWKQVVAGMAGMKTDRAVRQIVPLAMNQLSAAEMGKAWSVIDYLVRQDPKKFTQFLTLMKQYWPKAIVAEHTEEKARAQERALRETFGVDFDSLDQKWRDWVGANYR